MRAGERDHGNENDDQNEILFRFLFSHNCKLNQQTENQEEKKLLSVEGNCAAHKYTGKWISHKNEHAFVRPFYPSLNYDFTEIQN